MAPLGTDELIGRLSAELNHLKNGSSTGGEAVLAFDADGTLWDGDVGLELFTKALERRVLRDHALQALNKEARHLGITEENDPHLVGTRLLELFLQEKYDERRAFSMMAWAFAGFTEAELDAFLNSVLEQYEMGKRYRAELTPVIDWAHENRIRVLVVSASPIAIVRRAVTFFKIPATGVLAMDPATNGKHLLPYLAFPPVYAEGKLAAIRRTSSAEILAAFGDSGYDSAMLREARIPVAIDPKASLREAAAAIPGLVELRTQKRDTP